MILLILPSQFTGYQVSGISCTVSVMVPTVFESFGEMICHFLGLEFH